MNYNKIYYSLIEKRRNNPVDTQDYFERHHIIPRCVGGNNNKNNLINLTAREHFIAHLLLTKIYRHNLKILYAFMMMLNMNRTLIGYNHNKIRIYYKNNSRLYDKLRREYSFIRSSKITFNGETHTIKEWIKLNDLKISVNSFRDRIKNGWKIDDILSKPKRELIKYKINDKLFTLSELGLKLNINRDRIQSRIKDGWMISEAVSTPAIIPQKHLYKGEYKTLRQWSIKLNIPYLTLYSNMKKYDSIKKSIEMIRLNKTKVYTIDNKTGTLRELSKMFDIKYPSLITRIDNGMSLESALKTPIKKEKEYTVGNETHTLKECAKIINIDVKALRKRIKDKNGDYITAITMKTADRYHKPRDLSSKKNKKV